MAKLIYKDSFAAGVIACGLTSLFYAYNFLARVAPSAMTSELMRHFSVSAGKLGILTAIFYYAYALMQIPTGMLFDRFPAKKILTVMALICAIGVMLFAASDSLLLAAVGRFLLGFAAASASIGGLVLAARWFPTKYTLVIGLMQMLGCFGAILGQRPVAVAVKYVGWRSTLVLIGIVGLVIAVLIWLLVIAKHDQRTTIKQPISFKQVLLNSQNWYLFIYGAAIWAPLSIFASLWGVPFMVAKLHVTNITAATMVSVIWLGMGVNGPIIGWWSEYQQTRKPQLAFSAAMGLVAATAIIYLPAFSTPITYLLLLLFGASISGMGIAFGAIKNKNSAVNMGIVCSLLNSFMLLGGMVMQPLAGFILQLFWHGEKINNAPVYSITAYHWALLAIPLCFIVCLLLSLWFIKD